MPKEDSSSLLFIICTWFSNVSLAITIDRSVLVMTTNAIISVYPVNSEHIFANCSFPWKMTELMNGASKQGDRSIVEHYGASERSGANRWTWWATKWPFQNAVITHRNEPEEDVFNCGNCVYKGPLGRPLRLITRTAQVWSLTPLHKSTISYSLE